MVSQKIESQKIYYTFLVRKISTGIFSEGG